MHLVHLCSSLLILSKYKSSSWSPKYSTRGVLLLQDNAPAHTSQVAMTAATECGFEVLPHPPYSPDMAPSDFYLLPKLKANLCGTQFGSNEGVIKAVNEYLGDQGDYIEK